MTGICTGRISGDSASSTRSSTIAGYSPGLRSWTPHTWASCISPPLSSGYGEMSTEPSNFAMCKGIKMELTHRMAVASSADSSRTCRRDLASGGDYERDIRDERRGPFDPGECSGTGHTPQHGAPVTEVAGGDAAPAAPGAGCSRILPAPCRAVSAAPGTAAAYSWQRVYPQSQSPGRPPVVAEGRLFHRMSKSALALASASLTLS